MAHSLEIKERNKGSAAKENATDPIHFLLYLLYSLSLRSHATGMEQPVASKDAFGFGAHQIPVCSESKS